jgi:hypothetical protein
MRSNGGLVVVATAAEHVKWYPRRGGEAWSDDGGRGCRKRKSQSLELLHNTSVSRAWGILVMYPIEFDDHELYSGLEHVETIDLLAVTAQADCTKCFSPVGKDSIFSLLSLIYGLLYC